LHNDGNVTCWGDISSGGSCSDITGVQTVYSTSYDFAALHNDGKVTCWGYSSYGGSCSDITGVQTVYSTSYAFAALHNDGNVTCWGYSNDGNDGGSCSGITDVQTVYGSTLFKSISNEPHVYSDTHTEHPGAIHEVAVDPVECTNTGSSTASYTLTVPDGYDRIAAVAVVCLYSSVNSL
jgi:hypothetical protein